MNHILETICTWTLDDSGYGHLPQVCVDGEGVAWVVWISWREEGEVVCASHLFPGESWSDTKECCAPRPRITEVVVGPLSSGVIVAWVDAGDPETDGLKMGRLAVGEAMSPMGRVVPQRRRPSGLALATFGREFFVAWNVRHPGGRHVEGAFGSADSGLRDEIKISTGHGLHLSPSVEYSDGGVWVLWQNMSSGTGGKLLARRLADDGVPGDVIHIAGRDGEIVANCTAARAEDEGVWISWQSDWGEDDEPGLVRWVELARLDRDGTLLRPEKSIVGVERHGDGEDQGFEAPSLVVAPGGKVVIIGNGSQSLRRQEFTEDGWSERGLVGNDDWQCRGRYRAWGAREGIFVAGRERPGVVVRLLPYGEQSGPGVCSNSKETDRPTGTSDAHELRKVAGPKTIAGRAVLFGDIHQHTEASDGTGTCAEAYCRARVRYGDDFVAVSDHESFLGKRTAPGEWFSKCSVADDFYEPGSFVTLHAYEWTGSMHPGPGHRVVYPAVAGGKVFSRDDARTKTSVGLIEACARTGAIVIPHHVGWTGADMEVHRPGVQPCFEIVSCHGAYERLGPGQVIGTRGDDKDGQFVADALDKGLRFGFTGGSDGHGLAWHHGVCRMEDSHRSGLTAVFCDEVTRQGVLDAISSRRCYATSGAKIGLWFEVEGRPMGEELSVTSDVSFRVVVNGTAPIETLSIVTNHGSETPLRFMGPHADVTGNLPAPEEGGWSYFFVRVVQRDGHAAWSSPIWLDRDSSPSAQRLTA